MPPVIPARTDCVNDIFAGQAIALRDFCAPGFAAVERFTFRQQLRSCSAMNAAVHTAATQQRLVGRCQREMSIIRVIPGDFTQEQITALWNELIGAREMLKEQN